MCALSRSTYFDGPGITIFEGGWTASGRGGACSGLPVPLPTRCRVWRNGRGSRRNRPNRGPDFGPRLGGRGRIVARRLSLGARIRRQARAPQVVRPCGRWGLTAQRRASKGGHHAINTEVRLGRPRQSKSARYKMGWRAAVHSDRDRLDLLDRFVESRLHARTWRPTVTGR